MADEPIGQRKETWAALAPWTKLFTAFKVALDPKKLLLAAAGIFAMWLGWWVLSAVFFGARGTVPVWSESYVAEYETKEEAWKAFKQARNSWNLLYEMAAPIPASKEEAEKSGGTYDAADLANTLQEYEAIKEAVGQIENEVNKREQAVVVKARDDEGFWWLEVGKTIIDFKTAGKTEYRKLKESLARTPLKAQELARAYEPLKSQKSLVIRDITLTDLNPEQMGPFKNNVSESLSLSDIEQQIPERKWGKPEIARKAVELIRMQNKRFKPAGRLRTSPWTEYRGPNPFLLVTGRAESDGPEGTRSVPWERGQFFAWLASDQLPVLLEPLVKFLGPVVYFLHPSAGFWNRVYLALGIVWTLAVWGLFGGAITRMAAVQVARNNEKIGLTEALRFAWARYQSYLTAPMLPLVFVLILAVLLWVFGFLEIYTFFVGDIIIAGLGLPLALILGLVMAVVLVGLIGWPMMYATISTEGSDSFDAISRSYSYVYQAPWHYLWYAAVALLYGAVLVFFVGLMGSLIVYLTKWGITNSPSPQGREPTYLFTYAPTSFGWRDLLLYQSPNAGEAQVVQGNGTIAEAWQVRFTEGGNYDETFSNRLGSWMVGFWLGAMFLLIVGFGYSFFWTASTIIYLLMRRRVDDTELDEIHMDEEPEEPYVPPAASQAAAPPPAPARPGTTPLNVVDAPASSRLNAPAPLAPSSAPLAPTPSPAPAPAPDAQARAPEPPAPEPGPEPAPDTSASAAPPPGPDGGPPPEGDGNR